MHLTRLRITPADWSVDDLLFRVPWTPMPGVVFVCMYPPRTCTDAGILLEGQEASEGSKYQPDFGVVAKAGPGVRLEPGQIVMCKPYDGLQFSHRDYSFIPQGRKLHLYGRVAGDRWEESVEAAVMFDD